MQTPTAQRPLRQSPTAAQDEWSGQTQSSPSAAQSAPQSTAASPASRTPLTQRSSTVSTVQTPPVDLIQETSSNGDARVSEPTRSSHCQSWRFDQPS